MANDDPAGTGLDRHRADDAIYDGFGQPEMHWDIAADGLATPRVQGALPIVAPLSPDTLVCMSDQRSFVVRNRWGEQVAEFPPSEVTRAPNGTFYVSLWRALRRVPFLNLWHGAHLWRWRYTVEPVRRQCRHLARQMTDFQGDPDAVFVERLCTARRDDESFFMTVRDAQYHGCELRDPRDPTTEARMDKFDELKVKLGADRIQKGGAYDVDAVLSRAASKLDDDAPYGGIFKE